MDVSWHSHRAGREAGAIGLKPQTWLCLDLIKDYKETVFDLMQP